MKILVTGGLGMMGYNFFQWLRRYDPEVLIQTYDLASGQDILNFDQLEKEIEGKDLVIHMAALTHVDKSTDNPIPFYQINTVGTATVLEACLRHKVKMIHISTSEVYGTNQNPGVPMNEEHRLVGHSHYAASKIGADRACMAAFLNKKQDVVILRPFNQYGFGQDVDKMIPKWINQASYGEPLTMKGDEHHEKDYLFGQDTASAIWACKNLPAGTIVNAATGVAYTKREIAEMIIRVVKAKNSSMVVQTVQDRARVGALDELLGDYSKLNKLTGWKPLVDLEMGIKLCVDWYIANGKIMPPQAYNRKG